MIRLNGLLRQVLCMKGFNPKSCTWISNFISKGTI
jgi:hypothetical protein